MSDKSGDEFLRNAGILLPCAEQFGFFGFGGPSVLSRCDRPYGHTGSHAAEGFAFTGARSPSDDARTNEVLRQIASRAAKATGHRP